MVIYISAPNKKEYLGNVLVKTSTKCKHIRPNIIILDREEEKLRRDEEINCPVDVTIKLKMIVKEDTYDERLRNLQLLYAVYKFMFVTVIFGALEYVKHSLNTRKEKHVSKTIDLIYHRKCKSL